MSSYFSWKKALREWTWEEDDAGGRKMVVEIPDWEVRIIEILKRRFSFAQAMTYVLLACPLEEIELECLILR